MRKPLIGILTLLALLGGGSVWWLKAQTQTAVPSVQLSANPGFVIVGTTTQIRFIAAVTSSSTQVPSGMNLLRISATGTSSILAGMRDDGTNGDSVANDKVFTVLLNLHETQVGAFGFQASVAIRGQLKRTLSPVLLFATLAPTSLPVVLPPDPGEAGKATLQGIDSDADGVRDDIQRYIVFSHPDSEKKRAALRQFAVGEQLLILSGVSGNDQLLSFQKASAGRYCLYSVVGFYPAIPIEEALEAEFLNTRARSLAYVAASNALEGANVGGAMKNEWPSQCSPSVDGMLN